MPTTILLDLQAHDNASAAIDKVKASMRSGADEAKLFGGESAAGMKAAEDATKKLETESSGSMSRIGSLFSGLGSKMQAAGLPMSEAVSKVGDHFNEAETKSSSFASKFSSISNVVGGAAVVAFTAVAAEGIHLAETYQQSTAMLAGQAGISTDAANKIGQAFLNTAGQTTFSGQQIMTAYSSVAGEFTNIAGHALNSSQAMTVMKAAMDASEASGQPLASVTKVLADTMLSFHMNVGQAADASNTLFGTSRLLGVGITDVGSSLQRLAPRVAGSGMSLKQLGGFMVDLSHSAGSGRQAMRLAGQAVTSLVNPSATAQKALEQMGISLTDANGKFIGMPAALQKLHDGLAKLPGDAASVAAGQKMMADQTELATLKAGPQTAAIKAQETSLTGQIGVLKIQASQLSK